MFPFNSLVHLGHVLYNFFALFADFRPFSNHFQVINEILDFLNFDSVMPSRNIFFHSTDNDETQDPNNNVIPDNTVNENAASEIMYHSSTVHTKKNRLLLCFIFDEMKKTLAQLTYINRK